MTVNFAGKHALLAGAVDERVIAVGQALHAAGARLTVEGDSPLWGDLPRETISLDTSDPVAIGAQIAGLGALDILLFQAGWRHYATFVDHTPGDWDAALAANFERPVYIAQAVAKAMIARGSGGRILFLSSVEGLMPFAGTAAVGTTLTMLAALARMMAVDLAPHGITVNVLAAGWVQDAHYTSLPNVAQEHIVKGVPLGRPGETAEVGAAAAFLASDLAAYITGAILPVDGGYTLTRAPGQAMFEP